MEKEAVRRRVLQRTIQDLRASNADADPDEIQRIADEAVSEVRAERSTPTQKKGGISVFSTGKPMASDETKEALRRLRAQRDRRNAGGSKVPRKPRKVS